ncbi:hypothetical protein SAMN05216359_103130 [Roseateles sp. YR242]|nr:hypothetical protein SAMN05216359_103130 [Roseateles sp. YR242]
MLYSEEPTAVCAVPNTCREKLKRPPADQEHYVAILMSHHCIDLAQALSKVWQVACPKVAQNGSLYYAADETRTAA